jgi:hypothetical protein
MLLRIVHGLSQDVNDGQDEPRKADGSERRRQPVLEAPTDRGSQGRVGVPRGLEVPLSQCVSYDIQLQGEKNLVGGQSGQQC